MTTWQPIDTAPHDTKNCDAIDAARWRAVRSGGHIFAAECWKNYTPGRLGDNYADEYADYLITMSYVVATPTAPGDK